MSKWLKGCEICNAGLINQVDALVENKKISVNKACQLMAKEGEKKIGDLVYTAAAIRARYLLHKGLRDPNPKIVHNEQPVATEGETKQEVTPTYNSKVEIQEGLPNEDITPEPAELSANHHVALSQAIAQANNPKPSELEKAAAIIKKAANVLERIVEGNLNDNGSQDDKLFAESIRRYGPSIIICFYQLGIDPERAVNFYNGGNKNGQKAII